MYAKYIPVVVVIVSAALYHMSQKLASRGGNPWRMLAAAYFLAFLVSLLLSKPWQDVGGWGTDLRASWGPIVLLGLACVGIEGGYMIAYRMGWNITSLWIHTALGSSAAVLGLGALFFHEGVTTRSLAGWGIALVGLVVTKLH